MKYKKFHLKRLLNELKTDNYLSESSLNKNYLNFVREANLNQEVYDSFRNSQKYKEVLEHVGPNLANNYYKNIREFLTHEQVTEFSKAINNTGNPQTITINDTEFNPTTLRYINVALDIKNKFSIDSFENIIEVGAGYGGQALILDKFFKIKNYTFVDLDDVNTLIKKFLAGHSTKFSSKFYTIESLGTSQKYDLLISNYAFSELPKKLQKIVVQKGINLSTRGYMLVNHFYTLSFRYMTIRNYKKSINNLKTFEEVPQSGIFNKLLIFDNS